MAAEEAQETALRECPGIHDSSDGSEVGCDGEKLSQVDQLAGLLSKLQANESCRSCGLEAYRPWTQGLACSVGLPIFSAYVTTSFILS